MQNCEEILKNLCQILMINEKNHPTIPVELDI